MTQQQVGTGWSATVSSWLLFAAVALGPLPFEALPESHRKILVAPLKSGALFAVFLAMIVFLALTMPTL